MKTLESLKILGLTLACVIFVAQGHIFPKDISMSPNNLNTPSEFTIIFTLDSPLGPSDYLRMVFPFAIGTIQPGVWDIYTNCSIIGPGKKAVITPSAIVTGEVSNAFFVQFYSDLTTTTRANLTYNVTYYLQFTATPNAAATPGINLPIQLSTVSNNADVATWIRYDSNPVFGTLSLAAAYPTSMTVTSSVPATETGSTDFGADYKVNIDFIPTTTIKNRARIDIQLETADFELLDCASVNSTTENTALLPATFQPLASNKIRATISSTLFAGNNAKYRFQCTVQNPLSALTSPITIQTRFGYQETIIDSGTASPGLSAIAPAYVSPGWDESQHKILLGWGYEASSPTALNIMGLYHDASATEKWYQSAKIIFKPKSDLDVIDKIQVVINTVNNAQFSVLQASIFHNLPDYSSTDKVKCSIVTQGYLTCQNVGQLQGIAYFVSFRFNFGYTTSTTTVPDFGKVLVQTQAATPFTLISVSSTTLTNTGVNANVPLFVSSDGVIATTTTKTSSPVSTPYITNGEDVKLQLKFNYFKGPTFMALTKTDVGIEFYTTNSLASVSQPACTISGFAASDATFTDCGVDQMASYTRLRFRLAVILNQNAGGPPATTFNTNQYGTIVFDPVRFGSSQFTSFNYVNENVFDFYGRWVEGFAAVNPAITLLTNSLPFFFTSVVYNYASLSNLQVGAGFFYSGSAAGSTVNDGTEFPTVIRVTGYLTPEEQTTADRLLLFFNDFEPQDLTNPCFGPTGITCNYVEGNSVLENTDTDARTDYTGSRRIEINTDLTQKFNIYIPVSVPNQIRNFGFFIATASTVSARATDLGIFATQYSKRFAAPANAFSNYNVETVTGAHIALTGTPTMGSAIDTTITGMTAAYIPTANSGTSVGAHYGYCANYDFTIASGFAFEPFYSSSATPEQYCVDLQYTTNTVPAKNMYCYICPVHATMTAGTDVTVSKFTLPTSAGIDFYQLSYVMSDSTGELKKATKDQQSALMSPLAPSDHSITFSPTDFKKGSKNVYARFSFTVLSPLPKTVRINVVPSSPSTDLLITPVTSVGCTVNTITTASPCTISGTSTDIQFDITAQDDTWPMMTHTIDFMVDASGAASGISIDTPVDYSYTIKVTGYTTLDVMHHQSTAQSYTVKNAASLGMGLANFNYLLGTQNARTVATFDFEIPSDILAHPNQLVVIDLGGIAAGNTGFKPLCRVLHAETQVVSNDFSKCDLTDLTQVKLTPNGHISGKYTAEFSFLKVPTTTTGITVKVVAVDGTTTIAQSAAALTLPTAPASTALASATYDRLYSNPGSVGEITITLTSAADIKNTTYLYVYFPTYYADRLGYQNLVCTADDLPLSCFLIKNRLVQLTAFPQDVVAGTSLKVKIYGVITPAISTVGNIFIALGLSESLLTLSEQIEVTDKASVATLPAVFSVNTLSLTSNTLRGLADYNISFTTDSVGVRSGNIMTIDLPDSQGSIVRNQTASLIRIYKTGDTYPTEIQSTLFGSRFKFKLTVDFNPKTSYSLVIKNVKTAEQTMCNVDKPTIIVTDTAENAAIRRSASNVWDTLPLSFVEGSSLKTLGWTDSAGNPITSLALTIGVYSPEIRIVPPTGENFNTDITFKNSQNILTIQPSTLKAVRGTPYLAMKLAASSSLLPSVILLDLDKSEGFGSTARYSSIFRLPVTLTTVKVTLPAKTISIVKGATSFLYGWELDTLNMIPHTELKIDVAITAPSSTVLSVLGPSSITYSLNSPREGFVFELTSAADPLSPPTFTLSLSGTDSSYYALETATVTVTVLTPPAAAPIILQALTTANYAPTRQQFSITTDQPSAIYWHVALKDNLRTTDCLRIRSRVDAGQFSDQTSNSQPQYGVFYIPVDNVATLNEIGNLMSNTAYSYILCPANQLDVLGTASTGTFTTADNGATMFEVNLLFSAVITRSQLMSIICVFSKELQLPNENVVAMDGTTCGASSVFDAYTSFDYKNLTLYIFGDKRTDTAALTKSVLTDYITSVTAQTPSSFQTNFNQTLQTQSLTSIYQTMTLKSGSTYTQPVIPASSTVSTSATDTTITVSGLQLSSGPGVFYGVASTDILGVPSYPQIRSKLNSQGVSTSGANALFTSGTVQLKFTNLKPLTDYIIYYYASNNDRTQYASLTEMKYIRAKTVASATANHASQAQVSLCLGLIISAIMLLL